MQSFQTALSVFWFHNMSGDIGTACQVAHSPEMLLLMLQQRAAVVSQLSAAETSAHLGQKMMDEP